MDVFIDGKVILQHKQCLYYEIKLLRDKSANQYMKIIMT